MATQLQIFTDAFPRFLKADLEGMSLSVSQWRSGEAIDRDRRTWLETHGERCVDEAFGLAFAKGRPSPGAKPEDYLQKCVTLDGDESFLAGIRFRGGGMPFVDILATTWGRGRFDEIWRRIDRHWAVFGPQAIRVYTSEMPECSGFIVERDQYVVAGPVGHLSYAPPPKNFERISLRECSPTEALKTVDEGFSTLEPTLLNRVWPADYDDLEECHRSDGVYHVIIDQKVAGVIAVRESNEYGLCGWEIVEEILLAEYRGHGFAVAAQRRLAQLLAHRFPNRILFGTIDATNEASFRTARRTGREEVASYWWLSME